MKPIKKNGKAKKLNKIFDTNHTKRKQILLIWRQKSQSGNPAVDRLEVESNLKKNRLEKES